MPRLALLAVIACGGSGVRNGAADPAPRTGMSARGLYYAVSGRGDPLVLIHGFQTDHREWDEVTAELAATRRVIRYDLRGHGRSADASEPFFAHEDLAGLLDELGIRRADIVGLSAGSNVALELALERPALVRRLVMVSPGLPEIRVDASRDWMRPIAEAVRAGDPSLAAERWWESVMMEGTRARGVAGERYRRVVLDNGRIWTQNPTARQQLVPLPATRLRDLEVPLLVIVGERDITGSLPQADSILARHPRAARVIIAGAGHMVSMERPRELAAELARLLSGGR